MAVVTFLWNGFAFAVLCAPQYGNSLINTDASLFNYAIVIMAGVTVIGLEEWWRKSNRVWFHNIKDIDTASEVEAQGEELPSTSPESETNV